LSAGATTKPHNADRVDWSGAGAAIASISAVGTALGLGLPLLSTVLQDRGVSSTLIGANTAVAGIASIASSPFVTPLARRFGVRLLMLAAIATAAASGLAFHYLQPLWAWFLLRLIFHSAVTALFILSEFWISASAPPRRRGLVLGIYATCLSLGFAVGPLIFSRTGSQGVLPFAIGSLVLALSAIPLLLARTRDPAVRGGEGRGLLRFVVAVPTATAAVLVFGAVEAGGFALFPVYGRLVGFDEAGAAQLLTAIGLGNVILQVPLGLLSDRVRDRRKLLLSFAFVGLAGSLCLPLIAGDWWLVASVLFVWGGVVAGLYTVGLAHLGAKLSGSDLAAANSAFVFCYSVGMLLGPQGIGVALDAFGAPGFSYALACFFAAYVALTLARLATDRRGIGRS
jgi:MFS family permease